MSKHKRFRREKGSILQYLIHFIPYGEVFTLLAELVFIVSLGTLLSFQLSSYQHKEMETGLSSLIVQTEEDDLEQENSFITSHVDAEVDKIESDQDEVPSSEGCTILVGMKFNPNLSEDQITEYFSRQKEIEEELERLYFVIEVYQTSYSSETVRNITREVFNSIHSVEYEWFKSKEEEINKQIQSLEQESIIIEACLNDSDTTVHNEEEDTVTKNIREIQQSVIKKYQELVDINEDFYGWLTIEETNIDLPVVTTSDNDYYLSHDYYQKKNKYGTLFLDYRSNISEPSRNMIIYGHNMRDGSMFHDLLKYRDHTFYKQHKTFRFDTIYGEETYEVVAAFYSQVYYRDDEVFKYYKYTDPTKEEMTEFIEQIKKLSCYDTGVEATNEDLFITLSTCAYHTKNGRFVVVGRKVEERMD